MSKKIKNKKALSIVIIISLAVLLIFGVAVAKRLKTTQKQETEISSMKQSVTDLSEDNSEIQQTLDSGEDESYIERVAREQYSYVKPEERVYYDSDAS